MSACKTHRRANSGTGPRPSSESRWACGPKHCSLWTPRISFVFQDRCEVQPAWQRRVRFSLIAYVFLSFFLSFLFFSFLFFSFFLISLSLSRSRPLSLFLSPLFQLGFQMRRAGFQACFGHRPRSNHVTHSACRRFVVLSLDLMPAATFSPTVQLVFQGKPTGNQQGTTICFSWHCHQVWCLPTEEVISSMRRKERVHLVLRM